LYIYRPAQPISVELNVIENIGDTIYEEINSNEHLPETEETDFRSESSFSDAIESVLKDESKYEEIDDLQTDEQGYLECATDSLSVVQSGESLPSSDGYGTLHVQTFLQLIYVNIINLYIVVLKFIY
jgi:hypothetical protein